MSNVKRVYVEKKSGFDVQAKELKTEIRSYLGIKDVDSVRVLIRYDVENVSDETFEKACNGIFSEPPVDTLYKEEFQAKHVQILFITRERPVMDQLIAQGKKVDEITNAFDHILKNIILDCDLCPLHPICDDVEELRQIHFARK